MKKIIQKITTSGILAVFFMLISYNYSFANIASLLKATGETGAKFQTTKNDVDIEIRIGTIISYVLNFLGVIFMVLTIYAGFLWMTATGEKEKIDKAKDIFKSSITGLIIILSANIITSFIISKI
jgi:hypothetical protein